MKIKIGRTVGFRVSVHYPDHWNERWEFNGGVIETVKSDSVTIKYKNEYYEVRNKDWWYSSNNIPSCKIYYKK